MFILDYQFTIDKTIESLLQKVKQQEESLNGLSISPELFQKIFKHNYLQQAYSSTKIEYSLISYNTAQKVLGRKEAKNEQEREVLNLANTHLSLSKNLERNLSDLFIVNVHEKMSEGLEGSMNEPAYEAGQYRKVQNYLGNPFSEQMSYTFPPPVEVPKLMKKLNSFMSKARKENKIDPILLPGIFHFIFIAVHPFVNGNGRTVRLLEDFLLKKAGYNQQNLYNLSQYYYAHLKDYHFYLNHGRKQFRLDEFIVFYLKGIVQSQGKVFEEKELLERLSKLHTLPEWKEMDKIDKKILNYLAKEGEMIMKKAVKLSSKKLSAEALRLRFQKYIHLALVEKKGNYKSTSYVWKD
jgi:Fic family protein